MSKTTPETDAAYRAAMKLSEHFDEIDASDAETMAFVLGLIRDELPTADEEEGDPGEE